MKLQELKSTQLDYNILKLHSNTLSKSRYIRQLIDVELLNELYNDNQMTTLAIAHLLTSILGVKIHNTLVKGMALEYGLTPPSHTGASQRCKQKRENTNMERYGASNPLAKGTGPFYKRNATVVSKYGCTNVFQTPSVKKSIHDYNMQTYGIPYPVKHKTTNNLSKPHQVVCNVLDGMDISYLNEKKNLFYRYNEHLSRTYNPIPDIWIPNLRIVLEIYGNYWHANPSMYKPTDIIKADRHPYKINTGNFPTASDIWSHDKIRKDHIESFGVQVHVLWESECKCTTTLTEKLKCLLNV